MPPSGAPPRARRRGATFRTSSSYLSKVFVFLYARTPVCVCGPTPTLTPAPAASLLVTGFHYTTHFTSLH